MGFRTATGTPVPAVTTSQMREVDRVAVEVFGLGILQMMENAGRTLAEHVQSMLEAHGPVVIVAGGGGNGGGGLCCARHLHNRGYRVHVVLDREPEMLRGPAAAQWRTLHTAGIRPARGEAAERVMHSAALIVDALIGYGLRSAPRPNAAHLIASMNRASARVISLDVPSGMDATSGRALGDMVQPDRVLTLALPKTGLSHLSVPLYLADIGIPPEVYEHVGIPYTPPFGHAWWVPLEYTAAPGRSLTEG